MMYEATTTPLPGMLIAEHAHSVLSMMRPDGHWPGHCLPRLLESALALQLLNQHGTDARARQTLQEFCRSGLDGLAGQPSDRRIDREFAAMIAGVVLGDRELPQGTDQLMAMLSANRHTAHTRKLVLLRALLELVQPQDLPMGRTPVGVEADQSSHQGWVRLMMAALRLTEEPTAASPDLSTLVTSQEKEGSWPGPVLSTLVILLSLARCGLAPETVRRGVVYIQDLVCERGGVPFIEDEDIWVTALAACTLADAGMVPGVLRAPADYLCRAQLADGGWSYTKGVIQADADDSAIAVTFLSRCPWPEASQAVKAGIEYLLRLQNPDGGFPTFERHAPSEAEITAKCLRALLTASTDQDVGRSARRAWRWLETQQRADGSFPNEWSISPYFPLLHVNMAARALSQEAGSASTRPVVDRCAEYIASTALPEGGWPLQPGEPTPHLLSTAYAISALAVTPRPPIDLVDKGTQILLAADDHTTVEPESLGPRPFVYDVPSLVPVYRYAALARLRDVPRAEQATDAHSGTDRWPWNQRPRNPQPTPSISQTSQVCYQSDFTAP